MKCTRRQWFATRVMLALLVWSGWLAATGAAEPQVLEEGSVDADLAEVAPGRLLYLHDAPILQALSIDVERR